MSAEPIRVLQVVQRYAPELGGLETHVAEVTARLSQREDIEVTVLTTDRSGALPEEDRVGGVRVIRRRSWPRHGEAYFSPGIVDVIRHGGWDLVHVQGSQTTVPTVAMLAARAAGIPYVVTFHSGGHSSSLHAPITALQHRINRPLLAGARQLIAVSRFERRRFAAITGLPDDRFTVIENGGALPPVPAGVEPRPGSIVTSGRLERYKGHHRAIAALPLVRRTVPDATLTVLGSGPYEAELRRLARVAGVEDAVTFRSLLPAQRTEMAAALAGSRVMAALSSYEAHPVGIMEAVALGVPVVGFDVAGIGDLVEDGLVDGVPPDADDERIATALVTRLRGDVRSAPPASLPTWERCADLLAGVYLAAIDRRRVVQVITTLTTGGAERQLESVVARSRHAQHVLALYAGGPVADAIRATGRPVEVLGLAGPRRLLALPVLVRRLRALRPDVVQVHLLSGQLWGLPAARIAGVRTVLSTEHSLMEDSIENRPLSASLRLLYLALNRLATRTIAVSAATAARLVRWGVPAERVVVVDDGIDFAALAFSPAARRAVRAELGVPAGARLIGAVGRLEAVKRFPELLDAVAPTLVRGQRELVIVGAGPLEARLRARIDELGVADRVHLTGPRSDVPAILSALDVLVSPSRDETFGMAVLEGVAAGLPVVHAQAPALDGLAVPTAFALPATTADEAADLRAAVDAALALGGRAAVPDAVRQAYDITVTTARLDALVDRAPARRGTARGRRAVGEVHG